MRLRGGAPDTNSHSFAVGDNVEVCTGTACCCREQSCRRDARRPCSDDSSIHQHGMCCSTMLLHMPFVLCVDA